MVEANQEGVLEVNQEGVLEVNQEGVLEINQEGVLITHLCRAECRPQNSPHKYVPIGR